MCLLKQRVLLLIVLSIAIIHSCTQIKIETQLDKSRVRLVEVNHFNMDPHIGDFSVLSNTFFRLLIGVDREGWNYVAQRRYGNLSSNSGVDILKTKDFLNFEIFKQNSCGLQIAELNNGELLLATVEEEIDGGISNLKCFIYTTSGHKTIFNKKFSCTQIGKYEPAYPWSWGISIRGDIVAVGEYGKHGQCGKVWYSRDNGTNFYNVFDLRKEASDLPYSHVHGVCVDPYFDRLYIVNGDGVPSTTPDLKYKNPRIWYWDYNGEELSDDLVNSIQWKFVPVGEDISFGAPLQFSNCFALKDCVVLFSDSINNGVFRIQRKKKEDRPFVECAKSLGISTYTKYCGGNMFQLDDSEPLFICGIREYSNDLDENDINNPSHMPNTYKDVKSIVYATYDGYHFDEVWSDNTYGSYSVYYPDGAKENRYLSKCGRDMSVYQLPNKKLLLKYTGRDFTYVSYNDNGVTAMKGAYVPFCNEVVEFVVK